MTARDMVKADGAITRFPVPDSGAGFDDSAGDFMAENLRRTHQAVLDFLHIRAADPAGRDAQQHFAIGNIRHRNVFHNDPADVAVDARPHAFRYRRGFRAADLKWRRTHEISVTYRL